MFIKKSDVWKYVKLKEKRASKEVYEALDKKVSEMIDKAITRSGDKKTITADDILAIQVN